MLREPPPHLQASCPTYARCDPIAIKVSRLIRDNQVVTLALHRADDHTKCDCLAVTLTPSRRSNRERKHCRLERFNVAL